MMNIVGLRKIWFSFSIIIIIPGVIALALWGLKPGIDFTGGQELEVSGGSNQSQLHDLVASVGVKDITVTTSGSDRLLVRYSDKGVGESQVIHQEITKLLVTKGLSETAFNSVGPSVSRDITRNAAISVALAALAIILYIAFAFRNTPPPVSPWSFGVTAIIAVLHDILLVLGVFAILGHFFGVEVDSLFVTAILTVIGFSVHDTIVVYDRIRENLRRYNQPFEQVVNTSILETFARSINTSLTVLLVLLAFLLFGGQSIHYFILALLIGIFSGTYSSIFNASPLLVVYNNYKIKRAKKPSKPSKTSKKKSKN
ncbi:protein translocase subunit SecF [Candidatus Saccharibacteria bacterium]|nr:protein translocase subunit SecF [Candidatus Saccharibacteria bacterium]